MFIIDLKTNKVDDIIISERYNNINIYEYKYIRNRDSEHTLKFVVINKMFWFKLDKNNNQIKRSIDGEVSFLLNGIYEKDTKKALKYIISICKQENIKQEIIKSIN